MEEIWRSVKDYEGLYEMTTMGRVKNSMTGQVLRPRKERDGYLKVDLYKDGVPKTCKVHRLVGMTFPDLVDWTEDAIGKPFEELQINHKDNTPANNIVTNLEWCTAKYNNNYKDHNEKSAKSRSRTLYQYTPDDQLVHVWPSVNECGRNGYNIAHISRCCNNKQSYYKGFKWSYILL